MVKNNIGKKKIFILFIYIMCIFMGSVTLVNAIGSSSNDDNSSHVGNGSTAGGGWTYGYTPGTTGSNEPYYGIRLTIVDKDGNAYGNSVEYIYDSDYDNLDDLGSIYIPKNITTKSDYIYNGTDVDWENKDEVSHEYFEYKTSDLTAVFANAGLRGVDFTTALYNSVNYSSSNILNLGNILSDNLGIDKNDKSEETDQKRKSLEIALNQLLYPIGITLEDTIATGTNGESYYNAFFVFEVTAFFKEKETGHGYYGSLYEIGAIDSDNSFYSLKTQKMPCLAYLSGGLLAETQKYGVTGFGSGSYFGGNLKYSSSYSEKCSSIAANDTIHFPVSTLSNSDGLGMIIHWPTTFLDVEDDELTCDYIINEIATNGTTNVLGIPANWSTEFDRLYATGGYTAILTSYPTFSVNTASGQYVPNIPVEWFLESCTCLTAYEIYNNIDGSSHTLKVESLQDNFSDIITSTDWKSIIQLSNMKASNIKKFFETTMQSFYTNRENFYKNNAYYEHIGYTPLTYEEYIEDSCLYRRPDADGETYWCNDVDAWLESNSPDVLDFNYYKLTDEELEKLDHSLDAYNLIHSPLAGFTWYAGDEYKSNTGIEFDYVKSCTVGGTNSGQTCTTMENFFLSKDIDLKNMSANQISKVDFDTYNKQYGGDMTAEKYIEMCPLDPDKLNPVNCTPYYSGSTCEEGGSIIYKDYNDTGYSETTEEEFWNSCVFNDIGEYDVDPHVESDHSANMSYYDNTVFNTNQGHDNPYCEVYCIEEISATLPRVYSEVIAGRYITLPNATIKGSRTCKTEEIKWEEFINDLNEAINDASKAKADLEVEKNKESAISNASYSSNDSSCSCKASNPDVLCDPDDPESGMCDGGCATYYGQYSYSYDAYTNADETSYEQTTEGGTGSWCSNNSSDTASVSSKQTTYNNAVSVIEKVINDMKSCSNWIEDEIYNIAPELEIFYSNNEYGYEGSYDVDVKDSDYELENNDNCEIVSVYSVTSTTSFNLEEINIEKCEEVNRTRSVDVDISIGDAIYQHIYKENQTSFHWEDYEGDDYINLGFSNLPVAYATQSGTHGYGISNTSVLDFKYNNLGHVGDNSKTNVDTILSGITDEVGFGEDYGDWVCGFEVDNKLICTGDNCDEGANGGIILIYRPIDLDNPFPDINSEWRVPGVNWFFHNDRNVYTAHSNAVSNAISNGGVNYDDLGDHMFYVDSFINNNRAVNSEELYGLEPMYTFILDPQAINDIRDYNDENTYGDKTGSYNGETFDFTCYEGTGYACVSDYLTYLIDMYGYEENGSKGICSTDKYRNPTKPTDFYFCRFDDDNTSNNHLNITEYQNFRD